MWSHSSISKGSCVFNGYFLFLDVIPLEWFQGSVCCQWILPLSRCDPTLVFPGAVCCQWILLWSHLGVSRSRVLSEDTSLMLSHPGLSSGPSLPDCYFCVLCRTKLPYRQRFCMLTVVWCIIWIIDLSDQSGTYRMIWGLLVAKRTP
jgi:hypothetical protein